MERQTDAIKEQANIMQQNAAATIADIRPWLLIRGEIGEPDFVFPRDGIEELRGCILRINNYGKTPARVVAEEYSLQIGDNFNCPPKEQVFTDLKNMAMPYIFPSEVTKKKEAYLESAKRFCKGKMLRTS